MNLTNLPPAPWKATQSSEGLASDIHDANGSYITTIEFFAEGEPDPVKKHEDAVKAFLALPNVVNALVGMMKEFGKPLDQLDQEVSADLPRIGAIKVLQGLV